MVAASVAQQRFQMLLVGAFALLVFVLAVVGTSGVTAYGVSDRTHELGIRAAIGATRGDIRRLVLCESVLLALVGIVIGGVAAAALSRLLTRFVFQVSTVDAVTFVAVPVLLASAALLATLVPATCAARVDPIRALRANDAPTSRRCGAGLPINAGPRSACRSGRQSVAPLLTSIAAS